MMRRVRREIFEFLINRGADIYQKGSGAPDILYLLVNHEMWDTLRSIIHRAQAIGQLWAEEAVYRYGKMSDYSLTSLQLAVLKGNLDAIKLLVSFGTNVNFLADEKAGRTALQIACLHQPESSDMKIIQFLIEAGADVNACAAYYRGVTAMQAAAITGSIPTVEYLFEHGADINGNPAVEEGRTAIEGAAEWGRLDMVQWLLNHGSIGDVSGSVSGGFRSAIELATKDGHIEIVEILEHAQLEMDMQISSGDLIDQMVIELPNC